MLARKLAEQIVPGSGDQAWVGQRREVVAHQVRHRPGTHALFVSTRPRQRGRHLTSVNG